MVPATRLLRDRAIAGALIGYGAYAATLALGIESPAAAVVALCIVGMSIVHASAAQTLVIGTAVVGLAITATTAGDGDLQHVALAALAVGVADAFRRRGALVVAALTRVERSEQMRELELARAVVEDRMRIARDVHDVLGHHLSAIAVQQGVGRRLLADGDAEGARRSFDAIGDAAATALTETRRWIGLARSDERIAHEAVIPVIKRIERLALPVRARGIAVSLQQVGEPVVLDPGLHECIERIVQEALTNVLRHASAATAQVVLRFEHDGLQVTVVDDGDAQPPARAGYGLSGMRERAAEAGGRLLAGPHPGGGWRVWASLPYGSPA